MSRPMLLDTNVILRHLLQDHARHGPAATALFAAADRGEVRLRLLSPVLCECVFVLESFYQHPRPDIARVLTGLLNASGVELPDPAVHVAALARFARGKLDFVDCLLAAFGTAGPCPVASFDGELAKFGEMQVVKPLEGL